METDSLPAAENPHPKLRWFQYSLRSLFLLTLLVAIGKSWLTVTMRNQRKEKAAAEAIEKAGGAVKTEPTWLGEVLRDGSLVRVTDVSFSGEPITDAILVPLEGLTQLRVLELGGTNITDAGLVHLRELSGLDTLGLGSTNVTDAGLVYLRRLSEIQVLWLENTKVTDAGLVHLQGLEQLQMLNLDGTKVTDQGIAKLQKALPNCKITHRYASFKPKPLNEPFDCSPRRGGSSPSPGQRPGEWNCQKMTGPTDQQITACTQVDGRTS
jgi:hypothetical protein